jgi:hypothetical protein
MSTAISEISPRIAELEHQLEEALSEEVEAKRREFLYVIAACEAQICLNCTKLLSPSV